MCNFAQNPQNPHFKLKRQAERVKPELPNMSQCFLGLSAQPLLYHELDWEIKHRIHCKKNIVNPQHQNM